MELRKDTESLEALIKRHKRKAKFKDPKSAKEHRTKVVGLEEKLKYLITLKASL